MAQAYAESIGIKDGKVAFTEISAQAKVSTRDPAQVKQPAYDEWENWIEAERN